MKYFLIVIVIVGIYATVKVGAHIVRSNTTSVQADSIPLQSSAIMKGPLTEKQKKKEIRKAIRREKLESIDNGTSIGTGTVPGL